MKPRLRLVLVAVVACALAAVLFNALRPREPVYQGRPLSAWLEDLLKGRDGLEHDRAEEAVRAIGTNALPTLLPLLASHETIWERNLRRWLDQIPGVHYRGRQVWKDHEKALRALVALGPAAKPAIPDLKRLLEPDTGKILAELLLHIDPNAGAAVRPPQSPQNP